MEQPPPSNSLPRALLLDVGFTLTFCHGGRIAELAAAQGVSVDADAIELAEDEVRREISRFVWAATERQHAERPSTAGAAFFRRMLECAGAVGADAAAMDRASTAIWDAHRAKNVWCRVGRGVESALVRARAAGIKLAVVSNSEGTVEAMLTAVGLRRHLDAVVDSWVVGIAKPDPRIFHLALEAIGTRAADAVMVGDTPSADVAGATSAGIRAVLVDPLNLHPGATVPRVPTFAAYVDQLLGPGSI